MPLAPLHLPSQEIYAGWPTFTPENPLSVLVSGCLAGNPVGYDGSTYGEHPEIAELLSLPNVRAVVFCPENFSFGTPRALCDIHGGDGHDVLTGRARVLTAEGEDWTAGMISAAGEMLRLAQANKVHLAVLMDISAACGSQVIYAGARKSGVYQPSHGVCAALLVKNEIPVVSQRDFKTLNGLFRKLDPARDLRTDLRDHHESDWYRGYFNKS